MVKPTELSPTQSEENESIRKLRQRSFLETLLYHSLIDELEEHLITNKEPYLLKTADGSAPKSDKDRCYFHLEGVVVEPNSKNRKYTAEDIIHKNIQLTIVYFKDKERD